VVLFVCHAGRADEQLYSHETTGLVSSLLRNGVRVVVAALWPLYPVLAVAWLEEFGITNPNDPIATRVDKAQRAMAKRQPFAEAFGEHPLVRSTFSVFGDATARIG
jgi:CHAT domain-containing protein